jgi:hypothetical protein
MKKRTAWLTCLCLILFSAFPANGTTAFAQPPADPPIKTADLNGDLSLLNAYGGVSNAIAADERGYAYFGVGPRLYVADGYAQPGKIGQVVSTDAMLSEINQIVLQGNTLFVSLADPGVEIFDISDPMNPRHIGSYATAYSVNVMLASGAYLYILNGWSLDILNISNPAQPVLVNHVEDVSGYTLTKWNDYLIVGDFGNVSFVNVQDPAHIPDERISYGGAGGYFTTSIQVVGNYLYGVGYGAISVLNIADIHHPYLLNSVDAPSYVQKMQIINGEAYLLLNEDGFCILDVHDPLHMADECRVLVNDHPGEYNNLFDKSGDTFFVTTDHGISLRSAVTLEELDRHLISPGEINSFAMDDQNIYAGSQNGIWWTSFSEPFRWSLIPTEIPVNSITYTRQMDVPYLITATSNGSLQAVQIDNLASIQSGDALSLGGGIAALKVLGSRLYVITNNPNQFLVIDLSDPMAMRVLSQMAVDDGGLLWGLEVVENDDQLVSAYIKCGHGLILDAVQGPTAEISRVASSLSTSLNSLVVVKGQAVYTFSNQRMLILDPFDLSVIKEIPTERYNLVATLGPDNQLWVLCMNGSDNRRHILNIYDTSQPDSPELIKTASLSAQLWGLQVQPDGTFWLSGSYVGILNYDFRTIESVYLPLIVR